MEMKLLATQKASKARSQRGWRGIGKMMVPSREGYGLRARWRPLFTVTRRVVGHPDFFIVTDYTSSIRN